jgi:hypothetical protein
VRRPACERWPEAYNEGQNPQGITMKLTAMGTGPLIALALCGCATPSAEKVANDLEHLAILQTPDYQYVQGCEERLQNLIDCEIELRARTERAQKFYSMQRAQEAADLNADLEAFLEKQQATPATPPADQSP